MAIPDIRKKPSIDIEIRPVTAVDFGALRELYVFSLRYNRPGFIQNEKRDGDIAERAHSYQANNGDMLGIFKPDGTLIGFGGLKRNPGDHSRVELCNLHLHPECHGQGLGRRIVETLIANANKRGYKTVELHVTVTQSAAVNLYQSLGFVQTNRILHESTDGSYDTLYMDLTL